MHWDDGRAWAASMHPTSFADVTVASIQFCLRQGGGWWGGGAGSMETAWMVSNYTFPFRIFFFPQKRVFNG